MSTSEQTFVRFLFSPEDQTRIVLDSIRVRDVGSGEANAWGLPQSMEITFKVTSPEKGAPQLRPLFPGKLRFIAAEDAGKVVPAPGDVDLPGLGYPQWRTRGTLFVDMGAPLPPNYYLRTTTGLSVIPTRAWFGPVVLSREFLLGSLLDGPESTSEQEARGLRRTPIPRPKKKKEFLKGDEWKRHAVSYFLGGTYDAALSAHPADPRLDDAARFAMPTVDMKDDGMVMLVITTAATYIPRDAPEASLDALAPGMPVSDMRHPRNGRLPARHVYREVGEYLVGGTQGGALTPVAARMLAEGAGTPTYFPVLFTRAFRPTARAGRPNNASVHFPTQTVDVVAEGGVPVLRDQLPGHGVLYVPAVPGADGAFAPVYLTVRGGMRLLEGATEKPWLKKASATLPVELKLARGNTQFVIARPKMNAAVMADASRPQLPLAACTYFSMRRTLRAFIDNRITGGLLAANPASPDPDAELLMREAWSGVGGDWNAEQRARDFAANWPPVALPRELLGKSGEDQTRWVNQRSRELERVWMVMFPDNAPPATPPPANGVTLVQGQVLYNLWQTIVGVLGAPETRHNFSDAQVGRGAPGSLIALGLGSERFSPNPGTGEGYDTEPKLEAYRHRIVQDMINARLVAGDVLQFWHMLTDYADVVNRIQQPGFNYGHSLIFSRYETAADGTVNAIWVIDQGGDTRCDIRKVNNKYQLRWRGAVQETWIAGRWED